MLGHPGKKLNFMTNDIAQYNEWNSETSMDWDVLKNEYNKKLSLYFKDLNHLYRNNEALYEIDFGSEGFRWIDFSDAISSIVSFYRTNEGGSDIILFTFNNTPVLRDNYRIGVPRAGFYKEIMNSDSEIYGGSGKGNMGGLHSENIICNELENSINVTLPPLGMNIYKWEV
jgi:1,4-alpha-glucan branching enzyme